MTKKYDKAKTPYARVLKSRRIPGQMKAQLRRDYAALNPVKLGREIDRLGDKLHSVAERKAEAKPCSTLEYISS